MATGDVTDFKTRLLATLPTWFGDIASAPIINAVLLGYATSASFLYALYVYLKLQTRIATATDGNLDQISGDFFGGTLPRRVGQNDASYRALIIASLLRERATRKGIIQVMTDITARAPTVQEWTKPLDCGAFGVPRQAWLSLPGISGNYASTPSSTTNTITGDIDIRAQLSMVIWQDATNPLILGKWGGGQYAYHMSVNSGFLNLSIYIGGGFAYVSTVNISTVVANGGIKWVRVIRFAATGLAVFFICDDGINWIPFGAPVANTAGNINAATSALLLGQSTDNAQFLNGKIYKAQIYNGINGTLAVNFDATRFVAGGATATMLGDNALLLPSISTWTQNGGGDAPTAATGPDGFMSAVTLTDSDAAAFRYSNIFISVPNDSARRSCTMLVKKDTNTTTLAGMRLAYFGGTTAQYAWGFLNSSTGAATLEASSAVNATVSVISAGAWWQVTLSVANNSTGNITCYVELFPAGALSSAPTVADVTAQRSTTFATPVLSLLAEVWTVATSGGTPAIIQEVLGSGLYGYGVGMWRRVQNQISKIPGAGSESSASGWAISGATLTGPDGSGFFTLTRTGAGSNWAQFAIQSGAIGFNMSGKIFVARVEVKSAGVIPFYLTLSDTTISTQSSPQLYAVTAAKIFSLTCAATFNNTGQFGVFGFNLANNGDSIQFRFPQCEDVTGLANQNPSEYVPVGVNPAPAYNGGEIDGVQYFPYANGNTVAANIVTTANGATITPTIRYGSIQRPYEMIVNAYRPNPSNGLVDADLYAAIDAAKPVATICWVQLNN